MRQRRSVGGLERLREDSDSAVLAPPHHQYGFRARMSPHGRSDRARLRVRCRAPAKGRPRESWSHARQSHPPDDPHPRPPTCNPPSLQSNEAPGLRRRDLWGGGRQPHEVGGLASRGAGLLARQPAGSPASRRCGERPRPGSPTRNRRHHGGGQTLPAEPLSQGLCHGPCCPPYP